MKPRKALPLLLALLFSVHTIAQPGKALNPYAAFLNHFCDSTFVSTATFKSTNDISQSVKAAPGAASENRPAETVMPRETTNNANEGTYLLLSHECFHADTIPTTTYHAIAATLYALDAHGKVLSLGEVRSQGTNYPIAIGDGTLLVAGHHFVYRYEVTPTGLTLSEEASVAYDSRGGATYTYYNRNRNEALSPTDDHYLQSLFNAYTKATPVAFEALTKVRRPPLRVAPLPPSVDIQRLTDCTIPVHIEAGAFNWKKQEVTLTVYSEDLYDVYDISRLATGDTFVYDQHPIVVEHIDNQEYYIFINDDIDKGGATIQPYEGGTYRATQWDDHSVYTRLGTVKVPLSKDFEIVDCGDNPEDPSITIAKKQRQYLETQPDYKQTFSYLSTRVTITDGKITRIQRHWIP